MLIVHDLRYAIRTLLRTPVFTLAALLSLAVGIASSAAVFSLVDAAMLRSPPFSGAGRLAVLNIVQRTPAEGELRLRWSWQRFQLLRRSVQSFEAVATSSNAVVTMTGSGDPEPLRVEIVSAAYLGLMRAPLVSGRGFEGTDDRGPVHEAVIGAQLADRRFGGATRVGLADVSSTVIGGDGA